MPKLDYATIFHSDDESTDTLIVLFIPGKDKHDKELRDQEQWAKAAGNLLGMLFGVCHGRRYRLKREGGRIGAIPSSDGQGD